MTHSGLPQGWNERHVSGIGIELPAGAIFYATPGHGFLQVDTRIHSVRMSAYDYNDGPYHVLLEEDCSLPIWLADHNLIDWTPGLAEMAQRITFEWTDKVIK